MIRATGIVRLIDDLGRFVIPKDLRRRFEMDENTPLEIFVDDDDDTVILKKYQQGCRFCGVVSSTQTTYKGVNICPNCLSEIKRI